MVEEVKASEVESLHNVLVFSLHRRDGKRVHNGDHASAWASGGAGGQVFKREEREDDPESDLENESSDDDLSDDDDLRDLIWSDDEADHEDVDPETGEIIRDH